MITISFHVVDLYHDDQVTSFADAAAAGTWGIIHKATTGGTGHDAMYATLSPTVQKSWDTFWLWQYTDSVAGTPPNHMPGIPGDANGNLDCNSYLGTREQLAAQWAS